jgi:aarF domain-containing kinase
MYPEVEGLFRGDVRTIKLFAKVAQPVHVPALEEIEKQFMNEFDYERESKQLAEVRENLLRAGLTGDENKLCAVPKPYLDLCTKRVLVMEELPGDKLSVGLREDMKRHAARAGQTVEEFLAKQRAKDEEAEARGETLQGPTTAEFDAYISILNRERQMENVGNMLYNATLGWLPGKQWKKYKGKNELPINHARMIDDLIYVHGHEVISISGAESFPSAVPALTSACTRLGN